MNISMAFPNTFSGGILCTFHKPRVPIYCAPVTSISCGTKRSAFTVHATQDDYAVTGSRKNIKSHSSPNATTNNAAKTSTSAEHKNSWYIAGLRLPEFLLPSSSGESRQDFIHKAESSIERTIFNFRFFALLAISGSLAGSLLCFLNGCVYIFESFKVYWTNCVKGVHTGQMVLRLVEAVDVYLAGTVMLIFGMGLYGLFISDLPANMTADKDRALANSSLFGMFVLKESARWQMARVSDSPPLEKEFSDWEREVERSGGRMISRAEVEEKINALKKINQFVYSAETVKQMLQEKKLASKRPSNVAAEKDRVRREMELAESRHDYSEVERIKVRLKELEVLSLQSKSKDAKALMLAEMNKKNKAENFKNASEIKPLNLNLKAGEAGYDPFTRRWTQSQNYYDTKAKVAEDNTDANKEADAAKVEEAIAIETAEDDGKLVDTDAPVSEDAKVYSLHDFELPISLAGLQKYGGAQGAPLAFMARKQKIESTCGVQVPSNDGRRHSLTLTVNDYKRRRGLL